MLSPFRFEGVYHGLLSICGQKQQLFIWGGISPTRGGGYHRPGGGISPTRGGGISPTRIKKYRHKINNLLIN